jgi:hypothetical protein
MNQRTKKSLKITGLVIVCILALMAILPYAFRGKIEKILSLTHLTWIHQTRTLTKHATWCCVRSTVAGGLLTGKTWS